MAAVPPFGFEKLMLAPITATRHHAELRFGRGVIMLGTGADEYGTTAPRDSAHTHGTFVYLDGHDWFFTRPPRSGKD